MLIKRFGLPLLLVALLGLVSCTRQTLAEAGPTLSDAQIARLDAEELYPDAPITLETIYNSLAEIREDADAILEVKVSSPELVFRNSDIWTNTEVEIQTVLKGPFDAGAKIRVYESGAHAGKVTGGLPQMTPGECYFLFLDEIDSKYYICGAFQGRFIVKENYVFQQAIEHIKLANYQPQPREAFIEMLSTK